LKCIEKSVEVGPDPHWKDPQCSYH
jgi:hypothetical protein